MKRRNLKMRQEGSTVKTVNFWMMCLTSWVGSRLETMAMKTSLAISKNLSSQVRRSPKVCND